MKLSTTVQENKLKWHCQLIPKMENIPLILSYRLRLGTKKAKNKKNMNLVPLFRHRLRQILMIIEGTGNPGICRWRSGRQPSNVLMV